MPTNQPSNAPGETPSNPGEDATAAAVLSDEQLDATPGGGGLRGRGAADSDGGSLHAGGGQTSNSPIDVPTPSTASADLQAGHEAAVRAAGADAAEDDPTSL
jgi:hypothetical protein